jgi:hypothetical protein
VRSQARALRRVARERASSRERGAAQAVTAPDEACPRSSPMEQIAMHTPAVEPYVSCAHAVGTSAHDAPTPRPRVDCHERRPGPRFFLTIGDEVRTKDAICRDRRGHSRPRFESSIPPGSRSRSGHQ